MAFIVIFSQMIQHSYERKSLEQKTNDTIKQSNILLNELVSSGYFNGESNLNMENQIDQLAAIFDGRIMIVDADYCILRDTYQLKQGKYLISSNAIKAMTGVMTETENNQIKDGYIQCYIPVFESKTETKEEKKREEKTLKEPAEQKNSIGLMVVYASLKDTYSILKYANKQSQTLLILFTICVLIVAVFITMVLTGHFRELIDNINAIAAGHKNETVVLHGFTEMKELSEAFHNAVARLDKLEESRQEFVSNVSHELKTPITSMKVLADSLLTQEDIPAEMYREFMEDIVDEIDRENKIINDLLSLVKMDRKSDNVLNVTTVNINELLELLLKRLRPLAAVRNIEVVYESYRCVNAEIDEVKLTLALSNLIENAIKYNKDEGWVRITLNADHKYFYVKIADSGVGIPEDCQGQVFERFYRVDKARSRDTGGTGLGLSITHNAVSMHHGTIKLHSKLGEGTTFTVRIPLTYNVPVYNKAVISEKKHFRFGMRHNVTPGNVSTAPMAVKIKSVSEVQGNLGEVITEAKQNIELQNAEKKKEETVKTPETTGTTVVEPAPLEDAEPEMVVLHTEEMDNPEVVVLQPEELEKAAETVADVEENQNETRNNMENLQPEDGLTEDITEHAMEETEEDNSLVKEQKAKEDDVIEE